MCGLDGAAAAAAADRSPVLSGSPMRAEDVLFEEEIAMGALCD